MYFPEKDKYIGFDFEKGDWVSPYGSGKDKDVLFMVQGGKRSDRSVSGSLHVKFPGTGSGVKIVEEWHRKSFFNFPYQAPETGYIDKFPKAYNSDPEEGSVLSSSYGPAEGVKGYFFRCKLSKPNQGAEKAYYYGKINGDIRWSPVSNSDRNSKGLVQITYYLNPKPNDRNMEFDPVRNRLEDVDKRLAP